LLAADSLSTTISFFGVTGMSAARTLGTPASTLHATIQSAHVCFIYHPLGSD
jgi:hypothetical protein